MKVFTATTFLLTVMFSASMSSAAQELKRSGFIGVVTAELTDAARKRLPPNETGILVQGLVNGGSAKDAGVEANDIITGDNDHRVIDVSDFVATVQMLRAGDTATLHLRRNGADLTKQLVVKPRPYESAPDVKTQYKVVEVDGSLRRVIVTVPKTPGRHPAVLFVTGIGCFSQESADLSTNDVKLLYGLTRAGFVTMRVEKSGIGDSEGAPCLGTAVDLSAERRGYLAGLKTLKNYPFVDAGNVFLVGLSIGGVQAPLIAEEVPVKGIVAINTVIKPFLEYLVDTRRRQSLLAHRAYDEMDRRARLNEICNHRLLIEKQSFDDVKSGICRSAATL